MTPPAPPKASWIETIKNKLALLLGDRYATAIEMFDAVLKVFAGTLITKAISMGITIPGVTSMAWWHAVLYAAGASVVTLITGWITYGFTGSVQLLSWVSQTLRARRDSGYRVAHRVSLRRPRAVDRPGRHEKGNTTE